MKNNKKNSILIYFLMLGALFMVVLTSGCAKDGAAKNPVASQGGTDDGLVRGGDEGPEGEAEEEQLRFLMPVVNLSAQAERLHIGEEIGLLAKAVDPSGGELEYAWSASVGQFVNAEAGQALWQAPGYSTRALLTCKVTDMRGRVSSDTIGIDVMGRTIVGVRLLADASSLFINSSGGDVEGFVPLVGAKVSIEGTDVYEFSDANGVVKLNLTPELLGETGVVRVNYQNWDISYESMFPLRDGETREDELIFSPGFEGTTVALGQGDSFSPTYGMVEVRPVENVAGPLRSIQEVSVSVGDSTIKTAETMGRVVVSASRFGSATDLRVSKSGYLPLQDLKVPLEPSLTTLVQTKLVKNGETSGIYPFISYIKPYMGQTGVALDGAIEIGFGQPMNQENIFTDFEMLISNKTANEIMGISGGDLARKFGVVWLDSYTLSLTPKWELEPNSIYGLSIKKWRAYTADGRALRDYTGFYREFRTAK